MRVAEGEAAARDTHVELRRVTKRFGGVTALADVDLVVRRGTVHALIGENGAGKSTLGRVLCGAHSPEAGTLLLNGDELQLSSPRQALRHGLALVSQEPMLVPQRSVLENVFLGREAGALGMLRNKRELLADFAELAELTSFRVSPTVRVRQLPMAERQRVAVIRALACRAELVVLDEPTSTLTAGEAEHLLALVRKLRDTGRTVVYISHSLREVLSIADTVTVLRDGRVIHTRPAASETPESLMAAMLGRALLDAPPRRGVAADGARPILSVRGLSRHGVFEDVSLTVHAGEIVGIAGLVGSGRSELIRAILGAERPDAGAVELEGRPMTFRTPRQAWGAGVAYVPESRTTEGLLLNRSLSENVTLPHLRRTRRLGLGPTRDERRRVAHLLSHLDIRARSPDAKASTLSGGNQQKTLLARCLYRTPRLLVADEPTRGVDVGARRAIYRILSDLAAGGLAVLLVSSETEEVLGLAGRVLVMRAGHVVAEFPGESASEEQVLHAALGLGAAA
jgi:ABC-type sugar transport system ATPase subunit